MLTETDILAALTVCYDPELGIDIVDLGRVHAVHIAADTEAPGPALRARVTIDLLPRNEEQDAMLAAQVTNRLYGLRDISQATVTVLDHPAWTPDRMTPSGRRSLGQQRGLIQLG